MKDNNRNKESKSLENEETGAGGAEGGPVEARLRRKQGDASPRAAAAVVLILAALVAFFVMKLSVDRAVSNLELMMERLEEHGRSVKEISERFEKGEVELFQALYAFNRNHAAAMRIAGDVELVRLPGYVVVGRSGFERRKRQAADLCLAEADYFFALAGSAHLRFLGENAETEGHDITAERLLMENRKLWSDYRSAGATAELKANVSKPAGDAQYIFVLLMDAARPDHLSTYGYHRDTASNINSIARDAVVFDNAFSQCSTTDTSVASLFTALYPRSHKMMGGSDWLWERTLIDEFRRAGFTTGAFSANELICAENHYDNGFDHFELLPWNRATIVVGQTIRWLERRRASNDKIFAYLHFIDPHDMYLAPYPYFDTFDPGRKIGITAMALTRLLEEWSDCGFDPYTENWNRPDMLLECFSKVEGFERFSERDVKNMVARYDAELAYLDSEIGRFVDYLKAEGMFEKSIIVILADHGESFLEHNRAKHGRSLYDNEIRAPLVIWNGRQDQEGRRVSEQVELIDVLPTIFGMVGMKVPAGLHGRDLFAARPAENADPVYSLSWNGFDISSKTEVTIESVRRPPYKYIMVTPGGSDTAAAALRDEFYNIETDPGELEDARGSFPAEYERLREMLLEWRTATDIVPERPVKEGADRLKLKKLRDLGYVK